MKKVMVCVALLLVFASHAFASPLFSVPEGKYYAYCRSDLDDYSKRGGTKITSVFEHQDDLTVVERIVTMFEKRGFEIVNSWVSITDDAIVLRMNKGKETNLQIVMQATIMQGSDETAVEYMCLRWYPYNSFTWFDTGGNFPTPCKTKHIAAGIKDVEEQTAAPSATAHLFIQDVTQYREYVKKYREDKRDPIFLADFWLWKRSQTNRGLF